MKKKRKQWISVLLLLVFFMAVDIVFIGNPVLFFREQALKKAIKGISEDTQAVTLEELIPFSWDCVYTFLPYMPKEKIWEIIGTKDRSVSEAWNEGMVQLVFLRKGKVAASVCEYEETLGFRVEIPIGKEGYGKLSYGENVGFSVSFEEGRVVLKIS